MATTKRPARPRKPKRPESKNFNMKIPVPVWRRLEAVAVERGVSVAALLLSTTMKDVGPG